jgi:WD40 repeat protein
LTCLAVSPDGRRIAASGLGRAITVWDRSTGCILETLHSHNRTFSALSFSHNGRLLASGGDDVLVRLWSSSKPVLLGTPADQ